MEIVKSQARGGSFVAGAAEQEVAARKPQHQTFVYRAQNYQG